MDKVIHDFVILMRQKGYRNPFRKERSLFSVGGRTLALLEDYLKEWLLEDGSELSKRAGIFLSYHLDSCIHREGLDCRFHIVFLKSGQIRVPELRIELDSKRENRTFRPEHNMRIPGANIIATYLPVSSPWDDLKRGRFKGF